MLNFMHLVKVASPREAPQEGLILYFPRINHDMLCVPMESVKNIIPKLEEQFGEDFGYAIRAALVR